MYHIQPETIAPLLARLLLGSLFLFQGYDKIFTIKIKAVFQTIEPSYTKIGLPDFMIKGVAYFTSYVEMLGGLLLIIGILKYFSLYLLGIDLILVSIGMSLLEPVWKMEFVFPRFVLVVFLLIYPAQNDIFTLHNLIVDLFK